MKVWLLLLGLAFVASAASTDPHKPVRGVLQMCANCQARRWPELRRFIKDAVQGGEYGQQLSLEYARADKPLLVVYGPYDQVVGRFNIADQPQEKLHELVQNFGFNRAPASTSKVAAGYNAFASDVADPTAGLNNGLGNGLNSAFYNAYGVYNAYSAFGAAAAAAGTDPNSILAAGSYWPGGAVAPSGLGAGGVGAQAGLDYNAAALGGSHLGALNTGNLGAVSPGSAFSTLGAASNAAAAGSWGALGAATATGTVQAGAALPAAGAGAAGGHAAGGSGTLGAAAPAAGAAGAGAAAGGLGGFGALGGGLGAFGAGGGLGSLGGGLGGGLGSAASLLGGGGGSLLGAAAPAAAEEKPRPYPIGFSGFGRRRRQ